MSLPPVALFAIAGAVVGATPGCGGGGAGASCTFTDLCAQVMLAQVTAACGTSAAATIYQSMPGAVVTTDDCEYERTGGGLAFETLRLCFGRGAGDAQIYYAAAHDAPLPGDYIREEVSALGDAAFFRYTAMGTIGELYVRHGGLMVGLQDYEATDGPATKACLTALAPAVLTAR